MTAIELPPAPVEGPLPVPCRLGEYELLERLGEGGMGAVYRARRSARGDEVALKVLSPKAAGDPDALARLEREARCMARLDDPHVVKLHAAHVVEGRLVLALELVRGGDAAQLLARSGGALPERQALGLIADCARGLAAFERAGLVHRDLKPSNVFVTEEGRAKLADLGLARSEDGHDRVTKSGVVIGTPAFMAPEQAAGLPDLDVRTDIHALGAVLYQLLTGQPPWSGSALVVLSKVVGADVPDPRALRPEVSARAVDVVRRAMAKERAERFQSARELEEAIERLLAARPTSPGRESSARTGSVTAGSVPTGAIGAARPVPSAVSARRRIPSAPASPASGSAPSARAATLVDPPAARRGGPAVALAGLLLVGVIGGLAAAATALVRDRPAPDQARAPLALVTEEPPRRAAEPRGPRIHPAAPRRDAAPPAAPAEPPYREPIREWEGAATSPLDPATTRAAEPERLADAPRAEPEPPPAPAPRAQAAEPPAPEPAAPRPAPEPAPAAPGPAAQDPAPPELALLEARGVSVRRGGETLPVAPRTLRAGDVVTARRSGGCVAWLQARLLLAPGARLEATPPGVRLEEGGLFVEASELLVETRRGRARVTGFAWLEARGEGLIVHTLVGATALERPEGDLLVSAGEAIQLEGRRVRATSLPTPAAAPGWVTDLFARADQPLPDGFARPAAPAAAAGGAGGGGGLVPRGPGPSSDDDDRDDHGSGSGRSGRDSSGSDSSGSDSSGSNSSGSNGSGKGR